MPTLVMLSRITSILKEIQSAFAAPDPMRFAEKVSAPPNWFGELVTQQPKHTSGPVLVNEATRTFEFDKARVDVSEELTDLDIKGLQARGLNPFGEFAPAYAAAKRYFAKRPFCKKEELAANSATLNHPGFTANTAKDVLAAFNAFLAGKPTF